MSTVVLLLGLAVPVQAAAPPPLPPTAATYRALLQS